MPGLSKLKGAVLNSLIAIGCYCIVIVCIRYFNLEAIDYHAADFIIKGICVLLYCILSERKNEGKSILIIGYLVFIFLFSVIAAYKDYKIDHKYFGMGFSALGIFIINIVILSLITFFPFLGG
ncbi:MAG: hypothetical protein NVV59_00065 [Chitinophagaceae bacterium]|nr:hypothetical protein [Chitinophagaceae bacterium]